jgi:hypothetical protein
VGSQYTGVPAVKINSGATLATITDPLLTVCTDDIALHACLAEIYL